jgi:hypothetical protein
MADQLTARQAHAGIKMKVPKVTAEIEALIKAGAVGKVFREEADTLKGDFKSFIEKYNLISDDPTTKRKPFGGVGRVAYTGEVDKHTNGGATKIKEAVKAMNKLLQEGSDEAKNYTVFFYCKDKRATRSAAPAPTAGAPAAPSASAVAGQQAPTQKPAAPVTK